MKHVFEKLALYRRCEANTSLVSDWLKVFLKNGHIILKIPEAAGSLFVRHLNKYDNKRGRRKIMFY